MFSSVTCGFALPVQWRRPVRCSHCACDGTISNDCCICKIEIQKPYGTITESAGEKNGKREFREQFFDEEYWFDFSAAIVHLLNPKNRYKARSVFLVFFSPLSLPYADRVHPEMFVVVVCRVFSYISQGKTIFTTTVTIRLNENCARVIEWKESAGDPSTVTTSSLSAVRPHHHIFPLLFLSILLAPITLLRDAKWRNRTGTDRNGIRENK